MSPCQKGQKSNSDDCGWLCQEFKTGLKKWSEKRKLNERGSIVYADGQLYLYGEKAGKVMLIEASQDGWKANGAFQIPELSKLRRPRGGTWTHPVIANGKLYLRDQELFFCFDIGEKK